MKNKLLISTALVGSLVASSVSFAETKVTGNLEQTYSAVSYDLAADQPQGGRALGAEVNIGLSASKGLDNGLNAKYGFVIEDGAPDTFFLTVGTEAVALTIANDYGTNSSNTTIPFVSDTFETVLRDTVSGNTDKIAYQNHGANAHDKNHVALGGKVNGTEWLVRYAPNAGANRNSDSDMCGAACATAGGDNSGSATEIVIKGSLGVEGLGVMLARETAEKDSGSSSGANVTTADEKKFTKYGLSYNFGVASVGVTHHKYEDGTAGREDKATQYGISGALGDNLSAGIYYLTNDRNTASEDEKLKMVQVGYNLGGLGIELAYAQAESAGFTAGVDYEVLQLRTIQKF